MSNEKYVKNLKEVDIPAHNMNFAKYILDQIRCHRNDNNKIAIENVDTKATLTFEELTQNTINFCEILLRLGIKKGDIVAVGTEQRRECIPLFLSVILSGATCTPFDLNTGRASFEHKINTTKPKYFICSLNFLKLYQNIITNLNCVKTIITIDELMENVSSIKIFTEVDVDVEFNDSIPVCEENDIAVILYSSGTTGLSKGVEVTHLNCILDCAPDHFSELNMLPYMVGEWFGYYVTTIGFKYLANGRKILLSDEWNTDKILRCIPEYKIDIMYVCTACVYSILQTDLSEYNLETLKIVFSSASALHKNITEEFTQRLPHIQVLQGYGMTEVGFITSEYWGNRGAKPGSVGRVCPGITVKIADAKTDEALGPNERGEIRLQGPALMKGYVGLDLSEFCDVDGFFRTGDLGYYDDDFYFYIVGRIKDIIIHDGCNLIPMELEALLETHPEVREAGLVGKPAPGVGEEPIAFVVREPGSNVTEQELINYIAKEVCSYSQLKGVRFIDEVPRNSRSKILRHKLLQYLMEEN